MAAPFHSESIETVPIDAVQPHPKNTRKHPPEQIERLKHSLREFGQYRPIVVQASTNYILAGNGVYEAARALGWQQIQCVRVDCDDTVALAILLADNRLAELSHWDYTALLAIPELPTVLELPVFDETFARTLEIQLAELLEWQANEALQSDIPFVDTLPQTQRIVRNPEQQGVIRTIIVPLTHDDAALARALHQHLRQEDSAYAEATEPDEYDGRLFVTLLRAQRARLGRESVD